MYKPRRESVGCDVSGCHGEWIPATGGGSRGVRRTAKMRGWVRRRVQPKRGPATLVDLCPIHADVTNPLD